MKDGDRFNLLLRSSNWKLLLDTEFIEYPIDWLTFIGRIRKNTN